MSLTSFSELVDFLAVKNHTIPNILAHMVLRTLSPLDATSAYLSHLKEDGMLESVGAFGMGNISNLAYTKPISLKDKFPLTDSVRNGNAVWVNSLPNWPKDYPALKNLAYDTGEKTYISFPIEKCGTPIAAIGLFSKSVLIQTVEIDAFLRAIANLLSLTIYPVSDLDNSVEKSRKPMPARVLEPLENLLDERQLVILDYMSQGRTNADIAKLFTLSESTIRQQSIKIFAALKCQGRQQAAQIFRDNQALLRDYAS